MSGSVDVVPTGPGVVELAWTPDATADDVRAVLDDRLAATTTRAEAYLELDDLAGQRVAARAGMRREGVLRGIRGGSPGGDRVLMARLDSDPAPGSREGFSGVLDTTMPSKRVIAQGLLRDPAGRVLVCETTYKRDWDLPGGIVDPDEAPDVTVAREVREELGVDLPVGRLLALSWMPRYLGWSDAVQLVYDLGTHDPGVVDTMTCASGEIRAVHWVRVPDRCAPYERRVIEAARAIAPGEPPAELHDGHPLR